MSEFTFFIAGKPTGKGRHRVAVRGDRAVQYTPKETEYAESEIHLLLQDYQIG